ncbi:ABC transporter ATP-binding protein [Maridesulfovibrio zosterae]|uniref:ABC transporter ATP-binding protein n=1 Tax=Maridesulfovibrio zosterae TaxID=82171 RepID=UPI0004193245|nr:ATP-binding cassette domain-containing protein [Maridesulfovibrio zosterae]
MNRTSENIISVQNLTCAYGDSVIIDNISFGVQQGEIFIILGGSGCGKSTVLKHMIGLYPPANGEILIDGDDIGSAYGEERLAILRRIGVMYQMGALFGSMTLLENVRLPLEEFTSMPREAMDYTARMKLSLVGLETSADKMPSELSGGMLKRGAIARAMALDPKILFLDEPSAGLDPVTSAELDELIRSLSRSLGVTFVIVTHELQSIFSIADRIIMLDKGTKGIIAEGDPRVLRDESDHPIVHSFFHREFVDKTKKSSFVTENI